MGHAWPLGRSGDDRGQGDDERRVTRASPEPSRVVIDARAASPMSPSTPDAALEPFVERELFGGAILASFPARYVDVSDFRPVPDNQVCVDGREP